MTGKPRAQERQPLVFLMGPTAAGKTRLALELAERLPLRTISVDSAMVYRGMDIGTGKPEREALARVPHRLIDIRDPGQTYSAADFRRDALDEIADQCPLHAPHRARALGLVARRDDQLVVLAGEIDVVDQRQRELA